MIPTKPFDPSLFLDGDGRIRTRLSGCAECRLNGPRRDQSGTLPRLEQRFGRRQSRGLEGQRIPFLVRRDLMYEIESTWSSDFAYTTGAEGAKQTESLRILHFKSMAENYAIDRGYAVDSGQTFPESAEIHTNSDMLQNPTGALCAASDAAFLHLQGSRWSTEFRSWFQLYMQTMLPTLSQWERRTAPVVDVTKLRECPFGWRWVVTMLQVVVCCVCAIAAFRGRRRYQ